jgi:hypothetical protein
MFGKNIWSNNEMFLPNISTEDLFKIIYNNRNRIDLFFDWLKPINSESNKNILTYLRWVKYLIKNVETSIYRVSDKWDAINGHLYIEELKKIEEELINSYKSYIKYNKQKIVEIGWEAKLKALELQNFYSKWDNLNLYNYLFFSDIPNVDTVKFPTRWRNYSEKIELIEQVLQEAKVDKKYIDRSISLERTHYDLTYLFEDKWWFREMLKKLD